MKLGSTPQRVGSLVIELGTGTAIINGERIAIPPTEFELLAALAARPGEVLSPRELLEQLWPNDPVANERDLRSRVWRLRRRIGDHARARQIVATRPRFGYLIDLPPEFVEVVRLTGSGAQAQARTIVIDEQPEIRKQPMEEDVDASAGTEESSEITEVVPPAPFRERVLHSFSRRRVPSVVAIVVIAALLSGSWALGYRLSQRRPAVPAAGSVAAPEEPPADDAATSDDRSRRSRPADSDKDRHRPRRDEKAGSERQSAAVAVGGASTGPQQANPQQAKGDEAGTSERPQKAAPPQPDATLYHLFDPDTGDHHVTTSATVAKDRQADGYELSNEGRVFATKVRGTIVISLDGGSAYIYRDATSAPSGVNMSALYHLVSDDDFFYTVSTSVANQAQAQGWARSTAGYVAT